MTTTYRQSLRTRLVLSFVAMSVLLTALFALVTFIVSELVFDQWQQNLMEGFLERLATAPSSSEAIRTEDFVGWTVPPAKIDDLPPLVRGLAPGFYAVETEGRHQEILIAESQGRHLVVMIDADAIESLDQRFGNLTASLLLLGVGLTSLLALWAGLATSDRIIAPVKRLAVWVGQRDENPSAEPLATTFAQDEVGELAAAFDTYSNRLLSFIEREKNFTADVAHELRTGLSVIDNTSELLISGCQEAAVRDKLLRIRRAALRLQRTIQLLLALSRENVAAEPAATAIDVAPLIQELIDEGLVDTRQANITIRQQRPLCLAAEEAVVTSLVGNLLDNAIRHGRGHSIEILVDHRMLEVRDDGRGIAPEELDQIFERRFRGSSSRHGEGLGLTIVQRLCRHYGWRVELVSESGRGTQARIHFAAQSQSSPGGGVSGLKSVGKDHRGL